MSTLSASQCQVFLDPSEVGRVSKIEVLDELEEWELIMVRSHNNCSNTKYLGINSNNTGC